MIPIYWSIIDGQYTSVFEYVLTALWSGSDGTQRPLDDEQRRRISSMWTQLIAYIEWDGGLMGELIKESCLTTMQEMFIRDALQKIARNDVSERFLRILYCKSIAEVKKFKDCFDRSGQHPIVVLLEGKAGKSMNCL